MSLFENPEFKKRMFWCQNEVLARPWAWGAAQRREEPRQGFSVPAPPPPPRVALAPLNETSRRTKCETWFRWTAQENDLCVNSRAQGRHNSSSGGRWTIPLLPTFKSLNWDWAEKWRFVNSNTTVLLQKVALTQNILTIYFFCSSYKNIFHLLCGQDTKSNKGIFDRNSQYMTRNRWLNKHPPLFPQIFPLHQCGRWKSRWGGTQYKNRCCTGNSKFRNICRHRAAKLTRFSKQFLFPQNELSSRIYEILHNKHEFW